MNKGREVSGLLEPCDAKVSRTVLRGGGGSNVISLPDFLYVQDLRLRAKSSILGQIEQTGEKFQRKWGKLGEPRNRLGV
jgi:hypothetical protein